MENITRENLYRSFFDATIGRFYSEEQSLKLLRLFALEAGIVEGSEEYNSIVNTIKAINKANIRNFIECNNFGLLCEFASPFSDARLAASALSKCYRERRDRGQDAYSSPVEWRINVYKNATSRQNKLEIAYIEYTNGQLDKALEGLKGLASSGDIEALSHLAIICYDEGRYEDAYLYLSQLNKVFVEELYLTEGCEWSKGLRSYVSLLVSEEAAERLDEQVRNEKPFLTRRGSNGMSVGGFVRG
ncbi:MAG: hypothetical protein IJ004_00395 [Clostridia bacterium]|nr:hypothetical protein [Clostridia bacterium]